MNLYFRLLWLFWRMRSRNKAPSIDFLDTSYIQYRALPSDCDVNMHLTNSRYLAFMDLARTWMISEMGLLSKLLAKKWFPIVNATAITYIRDIKPLEKFTVETRLVGWDQKYFYIEQKFKTERGLMAVAYLRGVFRSKKGVVAIEDLIDLAGFTGDAPALPEEITHWKAMLEAKKSTHGAPTKEAVKKVS